MSVIMAEDRMRPATGSQEWRAIVEGIADGVAFGGGLVADFLGPFRSVGGTAGTGRRKTTPQPRQGLHPEELQNSLGVFGPRWA
jgi:hypothetical protein